MNRDTARALDIIAAIGLLAIAAVIIYRAATEAEPLIATALSLLGDA